LKKRRRRCITFGPPKTNYDVLSLNKSFFLQPLSECHDYLSGFAGRATAEKSDYRHRWLFRARSERPRDCGAADKRDELPPLHSITSSATPIAPN
jgi:hypothetical protein